MRRGRGGNVTTDVLARICEAVDCDAADICEVVPTGTKGETG
ncbi:helix-turn-helix transcriptional regulator [uncultured Corynebacterium sp.]